MAGRNAQPVDMLLQKGKKHLTKKEIADRKNSEIKFGAKELSKIKPPDLIKNDVFAFKHWSQCIKEYKSAAENGQELISSSDIGLLTLYCKTYSEYERLQNSYQTIDSIAYDCEELQTHIGSSEDFNFKVKNQLRAIIAVDGLLRIEAAINKKMDMLIKMQDRLFLNPLAKIKNITKTVEPEKPVKKFGKFGGGASG